MADDDEADATVGDDLERRGLVRILHSGAAGGITLTHGLGAGVPWASLDPAGYAVRSGRNGATTSSNHGWSWMASASFLMRK